MPGSNTNNGRGCRFCERPDGRWRHLLAELRVAGASLLPFAAIVAWLGLRENLSRPGVWAVIGLNVLWVADSVALLFTDWVQPAMLGYAFVLAQAVTVAVLAELEYVGLKRLPG